MDWDLPGASPQYATPRNPNRDTYGPEVCAVMRKLGFDPMPWQRHVLDVAFEHEDGKLCYREVTELVPRQAGKTAMVLGVQVHRAHRMAKRLGPQRSLYTAQKHDDAREKLLDEHVPILEASPYAPFVKVSRMNGTEGIRWSNGSRHRIAAPTRKAAHGGSIDLVQVDEAFVLANDDLEQGAKPTQITRRSPQFYVISAAGDERSTYLRNKLEVGREFVRRGVDRGVAYFEWSADGLDVDPDDPKVWARTHPAVGFTIDTDTIAADHASMAPQEFRRAYLAMWPHAGKPRIVSEALWRSCADVSSKCLDPVCFAIDVAPDRSMAAVSAAGRREDGALHVEVIRHDHDTDWVAEFVHGLLKRHRKSTLSVDTVGAAASLLPELERRKIPLRMLGTPDAARSAGFLVDAVKAGRLRHLDQPELNVALGSADKRRIGDKWAWARGDTDITPLVSATLALWSLETTPEPRKFRMGLAV